MSSVGSGGPGSQDFELNLASIIDCFTVLITFLLASASFLSIGVMDAGVAAAGATSTGEPPAVNVTIELHKDMRMEVKLTGKTTQSLPIPPRAGSWDQESLGRELASVRTRFPSLAAVTISADQNVEYRDVVRTMEVARKTGSAVMLGGF